MKTAVNGRRETTGGRGAPALSYVLITPAHNEEEFIGQTLRSMAAQTVRPLKWVIVDDGSTDRTGELVADYARKHSWIELIRTGERRERHFAGKVYAFRAGYEAVRELPFDLVGSMDADLSFEADHFEFLIGKFVENSKLGVGGTPFREEGASYDFQFASTDHVSGAMQLFRRECFEAIGGYMPVKGGGIDVIAVLSARMRGWETRTFLERSYDHLRPQSSANYGVLRARFKDGRKDYVLGAHPLWVLFRGVYQMTRKPRVLGGCCLTAGYLWSWVRRRERAMDADLIAFRRRWQMGRLRRLLAGWFRLRGR